MRELIWDLVLSMAKRLIIFITACGAVNGNGTSPTVKSRLQLVRIHNAPNVFGNPRDFRFQSNHYLGKSEGHGELRMARRRAGRAKRLGISVCAQMSGRPRVNVLANTINWHAFVTAR